MNTFLRKDALSFFFVASITVFGLCLALLLVGENSEKGKSELYLTMASMLLTAISLFMTISKKTSNTYSNLKNMKPSSRKKGARIILVVSLILLGAFVTLIIIGDQTEKQRLGAILGAISSLCLSASMYLSILKMNKKAQ